MRVVVFPVAPAAMLAVAGCSETAARTGTGAVVTAVTGGRVACGAAIGAGIGAVGGYAYDQ